MKKLVVIIASSIICSAFGMESNQDAQQPQPVKSSGRKYDRNGTKPVAIILAVNPTAANNNPVADQAQEEAQVTPAPVKSSGKKYTRPDVNNKLHRRK